MSVNKRKFNFNKKERIIFNTPKNYIESYIREVLESLKCNNIKIMRGLTRNQDKVIFYNENYIRYVICQNPDKKNAPLDIFMYQVATDNHYKIGQLESFTKTNIKKKMEKFGFHKKLNNICAEVLLKDYKEIKKIIDKSNKVFVNPNINEVLSDKEIDNLLKIMSSDKNF